MTHRNILNVVGDLHKMLVIVRFPTRFICLSEKIILE